ncbi:MAG: alanine--tRNA ligase [Planctomycetota bacterium]|nr:MAG: alanine--tRNA ligase [Planctomycetota bacterium]
MKSANEIRNDFLNYFEDKYKHKIVPSASLIPHDDPTLMFTNAGMNQFKDIFLGKKNPVEIRVANSQKIMRVSGKHNDLDEVGRDGTHHTFFEMLGNWSFGDYYKKEAISMAWELLTDVWKVPKDKLWITVFESDGTDGIPSDSESTDLWKSETDVDPSHIIGLGKKDNFWSMGETGPCGPCSEIHYNLTDEKSFDDIAAALDSQKFVEIWNLVFIQSNQTADGLVDLPQKHVDTGMGLERITSLLQKKSSNYDTDLFAPLITKIEELSGKKYDQGEKGTPFRVIADHVRAISFTIADGEIPSNNKSGYVIRKILRRAARFGRELGLNEPFLFKLVDTLKDYMGEAYPELIKRHEAIVETIKAEESRFKKTLDTGLVIFEKYAEALKKSGGSVFSGKDTFTLYDRYGFPYDLTEVMANENGWSVNVSEYKAEMEKARQKAQEQGKFKIDMSKIGDGDESWTVVNKGDYQFVGYEVNQIETSILEYLETDENYLIVLKDNPFYVNGGGQVGDKGSLKSTSGELKIEDAQPVGDKKVLVASLISGEFNPSEKFTAEVDVDRQLEISQHHTATHLLHRSLRDVLGDMVDQKGSLVTENRLRFDFSYPKAMTKDELRKVEKIVNNEIRHNTSVESKLMNIDEAKAQGATALFSEKYDTDVRVVSSGDFTKELCGGIHVKRLGDIGQFKIIKEESIAAGIRRIEAVAGAEAYAVISDQELMLEKIADIFKCKNLDQLLETSQKIVDTNKDLTKSLKEIKLGQLDSDVKEMIHKKEEVNGISFITGSFEKLDKDSFNKILDIIKKEVSSFVALIFNVNDVDRVAVSCGISDDIIQKGIKAGDIIKEVSAVLGGKGGGKPNLASGGGVFPNKIDAAVQSVKEKINK